MSELEQRIIRLEDRLGGQGAMREPDPDTDELIAKFGLDPVMVRAAAEADGKPLAEVIASELGMSLQDLKKDLKQRARGE